MTLIRVRDLVVVKEMQPSDYPVGRPGEKPNGNTGPTVSCQNHQLGIEGGRIVTDFTWLHQILGFPNCFIKPKTGKSVTSHSQLLLWITVETVAFKNCPTNANLKYRGKEIGNLRAF